MQPDRPALFICMCHRNGDESNRKCFISASAVAYLEAQRVLSKCFSVETSHNVRRLEQSGPAELKSHNQKIEARTYMFRADRFQHRLRHGTQTARMRD